MTSHRLVGATASNSTSRRFSSGREFYDDGYTEEECNAAELPVRLEKKSGGGFFFGCSEELQELRKAKQRVIMGGSNNNGDVNANATTTSSALLPAALVWGVSGTGKSSLLQQFLKETKQQSVCYILQGKYDEYTGSSDPFSAIVQALNQFSSQLKNGPVEELERIRKCIKTAFGNGGGGNNESSPLAALVNVVPSLSILLHTYRDGAVAAGSSTDRPSASSVTSPSSQHSSQPPTANNTGVNESAWNRLQYIFLQFVKAISTKERPVYLFLDDLQWSSPAALELLANLVSDAELKHFLFLGSIRQETNPHNNEVLEVDTNSPLYTSFLSRLQSQNDRELTQITTQNLSLGDTIHFLASLLGNQSIDDNLHTLAQKIYIKTQGNIFFTIQALEQLQRNKVLMYSRISFQWEWNFDTINGDDILISNNIVGVIESKLKQLSQDLQDMLTIAAYVRAAFDVSTLLHVIQNEQRNAGASMLFPTTINTIDEEFLSVLLEKAVLEQLLSNPIGGATYRFTHDRIQQAAYGMVPYGEERDMLRLRIGHCLLALFRGRHQHHHPETATSPTDEGLYNQKTEHKKTSTPAGDYGLLFVAADHLNSAPTKDHLFSVMLNLEVGERAIQMAALASAAGYLQTAANKMKRVRNHWEDHYDISLRLYRARCDVELSLGHFQVGHNLGDQVLSKTKTLDEKLPTYFSVAHALGRDDKHFESLNMCLRVTTKMGEYPKRWYLGHIARDLMKIKSFLKKNDDAAILRLPIITDSRKLMLMKLLAEISIRAMMTQNMVAWLLNLCKQIRNTMRFGLSEEAAVVFASYGVLAKESGDQAMAMRCVGLSKRIMSKTKGKSVAGMISLAIVGYIIPFTSSTANLIEESRQGYAISMEAGEFENGFLNWQMCILTAYLGGYELPPLIRATENIMQQSKMYRVQSLGNAASELLSMMRILVGKNPIDWDQIEESANREIKSETLDPSQNTSLTFHFFCRMILATYFQKYELGAKLSDTCRHLASAKKVCFFVVSRGLYPGIQAAGRYRETGKRKYLRMLNKMLAEVKNVAKTRGRNFFHHVLMLKAELASIQKQNQNSPSVKDDYNLAILVASNASFVQDAALTSELAGEHCIREDCSKAETSAYFVKAVGFYEDWGCLAKVDDLKQRRSEYLVGLNQDRRVDNRRAQDGRMVLFGNNHSTSQVAQVDILSSFTPSAQVLGSTIADSETKQTLGLREENIDQEADDDCDVSVLSDGYEY